MSFALRDLYRTCEVSVLVNRVVNRRRLALAYGGSVEVGRCSLGLLASKDLGERTAGVPSAIQPELVEEIEGI